MRTLTFHIVIMRTLILLLLLNLLANCPELSDDLAVNYGSAWRNSRRLLLKFQDKTEHAFSYYWCVVRQH